MGDEKNFKKYSYLFYLLFSVILFLFGQTSFNKSIKYPFSYIFNPIYLSATQAGHSVKSWAEALLDASSYIQEYNTMREEIVRLKIENSERLLDYEEYNSLKEHISNADKKGEYTEAKILHLTNQNEIILNRGADSGVKKGDAVVIGRVFVGLVIDVNPKTSLVRLPLHTSSSYEVVVIPSTVNLNEKLHLDSFVVSKGVVLGKGEEIKIENLGINSSVNSGDIVLLKDEKVEDILILGSLVGITSNPASTQKNGVVEPIFDYSNILTVFIKTK